MRIFKVETSDVSKVVQAVKEAMEENNVEGTVTVRVVKESDGSDSIYIVFGDGDLIVND